MVLGPFGIVGSVEGLGPGPRASGIKGLELEAQCLGLRET